MGLRAGFTRTLISVAAITAFTLSNPVAAADFTVGVHYSPASSGAFSLTTDWTFARWRQAEDTYRLAARADLSLVPAAPLIPSFGAGLVFRAGQAGVAEVYFGAGVGLARADAPFPDPTVAFIGFAGVAF